MKKLLFAIAGAAAFAAFAADPSAGANDIDVLGFENFDLTNPNVTGAVINRDDSGLENTSKWSCSGDDASTVKAYGGENATAPNIPEPRPFAGATNTQYLNLDTNGSELQRTIPAAGQAIAAGGTYVDTLVQFTPSESAPGDTDLVGAKLAIWLGVTNVNDVVTTNLYVAGGTYKGAELEDGIPTGMPSLEAKTYKLSGTYEPATWYRLTVKALKFAEAGGSVYAGFQISIDGTTLTTDTDAYDAAAMTAFGYTAADTTLLTGHTFIPSADDTLQFDSLTSVGFKGTGALDDFVVTTESPSFAPAAISLTLTWTAAEVDAVAYVLDSDPATTNTLSNGTAASIPASAIGTNATLVVTFASGYEFDYLDIGGYHHPSLTFPVPPVSTNATLVAKVAAAYPTYIDTTDAAITAKYDAWKTAYQADTASQWESAFLLNMDPTAQVAAGTALLKIASITEVSGGWELEIASEATTLTATDGTVLVGNGYLRIIAADTIAGLANATPTYINVAVTNGKVTVTVPAANGKFMKAELTTEAPSDN